MALEKTITIDVRAGYDNSAQEDSDRVQLVRRIFGITPQRQGFSLNESLSLPSTGISVVLGRSGTGKSTILKAIATELEDVVVVSDSLIKEPEKPLVDLISLGRDQAIKILGQLGLGEARVLITPFKALSTGQQARALLAYALSLKSPFIIADEFLTTLDRLTAKFVAFNFQRVCRMRGRVAFVATAHDDIVEALGPDHVYTVTFDGQVSIDHAPRSPLLAEASTITVEEGTPDDYRKLEQYHYVQTLAAESPMEDRDWDELVSSVRIARHRDLVVGVLVCTRPFPSSLNQIEFFRTLNERVLVFYRTIVHPGYRGIGIATRVLLPAAGSHRVWVSCSALGQYVPFRTAMGFERVEHPRNARFPEHAELEQCFVSEHATEVEELHDYRVAQRLFEVMNESQKEYVRRLTEAVMLRYNTEYCRFLARHSDTRCDDNMVDTLRRLFSTVLSGVSDDSFGTIVSEAMHLPVQGFVRKVAGAKE